MHQSHQNSAKHLARNTDTHLMAKVFPRQSQNFIFKLFFCFKSLSLSLSESNLHGSTPPYIYRSIRSGCTSMTTLCNNSIFRSRSGFGLYLIWVCVVLCFNMIYNFDLWLWFGLIWFLGLDYIFGLIWW